jgi:2-methylaconitate cis-trans-isomerase PrpF
MLAAVGPFSLEEGLATVKAEQENGVSAVTRVHVHSTATGKEYELRVPLVKSSCNSRWAVDCEKRPIHILSKNPAGAKTGCLLPTNSARIDIAGFAVSCVDVSRPMVIVQCTENLRQIRTTKSGSGTMPDMDFFGTSVVCSHLEQIRVEAAVAMGMGNVQGQVSPKVCVVAEPTLPTAVLQALYYVAPANLEVHPSIAMTAAQCLAASVFVEGSVANRIARHECIEWEEYADGHVVATVNVQNPQGIVSVGVHMDKRPEGGAIDPPRFLACSYSRTARLLANGYVFHK